MPSVADIELAFYERFFFAKDLEPYPVQEQAFNHIFAGDSTLVTVPTGTGKTLMAKAAIFKALELGEKAVYTTPLRALTEEKYRELCGDFGDSNVGFATGDYKVNRNAPIQVEVAEILWNRIFGDRATCPAEVVIMDEGHYFNDPSRGYVWEESIIGLDPRTQLVILSATVGHPDRFCHWVELTRRVPLVLVESRERRVPLHHEYREEYLIEVVRDLNTRGDTPAIIFVFGRERCFEVARLLKSCRRFTSDRERERIASLCDGVLIDSGVADELQPLLLHGIGIHHAGILPRYKQLVEEMASERLIKFIVSTETIAAGINLPAKTVVFPALRKHVGGKTRLIYPAEFHQMAGRAGRPQFDNEGLAICLAPEDLVQDVRKEIRTGKKKGYKVDEEKIRKAAYHRARAEAKRRDDVIWDGEVHRKLVEGEPAQLRSKTHITAEQVLAIGLPNLVEEILPGAEPAPGGEQPSADRPAPADDTSAGPPEAPVERPEAAVAPPEAPAGSLPPPAIPAEQAPAQASLGSPPQARAVSSGEPAVRTASLGTLADALGALSSAMTAAPDGPTVEGEAHGSSGSARLDPAPSSTASTVEPADASSSASGQGPAVSEVRALPRDNLPPYMKLDVVTIVDNLLMSDRERLHAHKMLAQVTDNLRAAGVINEHGGQIAGWMIKDLQGLDGLFIYYVLMNEQLDYGDCRELVEYLVDHDTVQKQLNRKDNEKRREWIRERLRERRRENSQVSWEDVEQEYEREFPRELTRIELIHQRFAALVPHPELHGGKMYKNIWATMEDEDFSFMEFVDKHRLAHEEGNLFSYLIRVMNSSRTLYEVTTMPQFDNLRRRVRNRLAVVDVRLLESDHEWANWRQAHGLDLTGMWSKN
ncbi:MAG: DEAD/DEAH box helicase [Proteobacteria bacterium]|nr:DEAD/DEAH box helicase [Pseudomonadota bacterium]